ncbi:MAG: PTS sugar transporter subunit IIA [Rhodobacteraceae bacterium]|nr:PTS sugar transporter subunit IIA [Paracoccaceae bacterium]
MELSKFLLPKAVVADSKLGSKKRVLQEAARLAEQIYGLPSAKSLAALQARELLGPTGMGNGVAIPHARLPEIESVAGVFMYLETPVDFSAVDRKPVDLVFVLFAPEGAVTDHLKSLARVSRTLRNEATCQKLRSTRDTAALYAILLENERSQAA